MLSEMRSNERVAGGSGGNGRGEAGFVLRRADEFVAGTKAVRRSRKRSRGETLMTRKYLHTATM